MYIYIYIYISCTYLYVYVHVHAGWTDCGVRVARRAPPPLPAAVVRALLSEEDVADIIARALPKLERCAKGADPKPRNPEKPRSSEPEEAR